MTFAKQEYSTLYSDRRKYVTANKLCMVCLKPRGKVKSQIFLHCVRCADKKQAAVIHAIDDQTKRTRDYAGRLCCSRCQKPFWSWDKRKVKRCDPCREWNDAQELSLSCEEARFNDSTLGMSHRRDPKLPKRKKINSKSYADNLNMIRQGEHVTTPYRKWTAAEIAARYTPELVDALLTQAAKNYAAIKAVPSLSQM